MCISRLVDGRCLVWLVNMEAVVVSVCGRSMVEGSHRQHQEDDDMATSSSDGSSVVTGKTDLPCQSACQTNNEGAGIQIRIC